MKYYTRFDTSLCKITLLGDSKGISNIYLKDVDISPEWEKNDAFFADAARQIMEYFAGKRRTFSLKINPHGTEFQKKVWTALQDIPYGKTCSYADIAHAVVNPKACRAVGTANSKNPIPLIIPCHRVIGHDGRIGGFSSGISLKKKLLKLESAV